MRLKTILIILSLLIGSELRPQSINKDPLDQIIPKFTVTNETVLDGVARLSQLTDQVAFCIEHQLAENASAPTQPLRQYTQTFHQRSVSQLLDDLLALDATYTWRRDGNTVNVFPRDVLSQPDYVLNRAVPLLRLDGVTTASAALFSAVSQLPPPKEQIAYLQSGGDFAFAKPWSAEFTNIPLRLALNKITQRLGTTYGWQLSGTKNFRVITFHSRLVILEKRSRR